MKIKNKNDISLSILLHLGILGVIVGISFFTASKNKTLSYVEVSFGLNENLVQTRQANSRKSPDGEQTALKTKEDLPQLTKNSAPKAKTELSKDSDALKLQTKTKEPIPKPIPKPKENKAIKEEAKTVAKKSGELEKKDFLKRKEEDLRKEGKQKQIGKKTPTPAAKPGQKKSLDDLPRSPFETVKTENAVADTAPTGQEDGKSLKAVNAYKIYLRAQLKRHWDLPDISKFSSSLITIVSFTVNEYGYLNGEPTVMESSHNPEFDSKVIEAVAATFPVSNPPPKDVLPPQTFLAKYNSKDIQ